MSRPHTETQHIQNAWGVVIYVLLIIFVAAVLVIEFLNPTKQAAQVGPVPDKHTNDNHGTVVAVQNKDTQAGLTVKVSPIATTSVEQIVKTTPTAEAPSVVGGSYIEVTQSCDIHYNGEACLNARSGPGTSYPSVAKLRNGMVLKIASTTASGDGHIWYRVVFDEWLRYPKRVSSDWYVSSDYVKLISNESEAVQTVVQGTSSKRIVVSRSSQHLYAYNGDTLVMDFPISTGLELTPTPRGTFAIYKKTPTRYMQGPLPGISDQYYDLPGVPWNLYFTQQGAVIHGAYWHNSFGHPYSHGCVNVSPENARLLYDWAEVGTLVTVQD